MTDLSPPPFHLGDIEIRRVMEMQSPFLPAQVFLPQATPAEIDALRDRVEPWAMAPGTGALILAVQAYLVKTRHHTILIDTCVGCAKASPIPQWHMRDDQGWLARLIGAGVRPEAVDYVFCTHLHGDHIGWNTQLLDGRYVPTFPNARYVFSRAEIAHAESFPEDRRIAFDQSVAPVIEAGQAQIVDSDFALDDQVWIAPTPGHTPGHVAVHLRSGDQRAVMTGDLVHTPLQCIHPEWSTVVDIDGAEAATTRKQVFETALAERHMLLTAHFPAPSVVRLKPADQGVWFDYV